MVLICFNVSVYRMDANAKTMEGSNSNKTIIPSIDKESRSLIDTVERKEISLFEEICMGNPIIPTETCLANPIIPPNTDESKEDRNEDTKMMEFSVDEQIIEKNTIDEFFPSTRVFPDVLIDSESTKEKQSKTASPTKRQEIDKDFPSTKVFSGVLFDSESTKKNQPKTPVVTEPTTSVNDVKRDMFSVQDSLDFCPKGNTIVLNEVLQQGIFASEQEMDKLKETKDSIFNKIITIPFDKNDSNRSMKQAIEEYLKDTIVNAKEYSSALNVMGIFSYAEDCPIENWLYNSMESLKGNTIELPTNWLDISELMTLIRKIGLCFTLFR